MSTKLMPFEKTRF